MVPLIVVGSAALLAALGVACLAFLRLADRRAGRAAAAAVAMALDAVPTVQPIPEAPAGDDAALRLLRALQDRGKLLDFLAEDVDAFSDADLASGARCIHAACQSIVNDALSPVIPQAEGEAIPGRGVCRHRGFRLIGGEIVAQPEIEAEELEPTRNGKA